MKANKFVITDSIDESRIADIERSIHSHDGINAVRIDAQANTVTVDYDEGRYSEGDIMNFVSQTGLSVRKVK